MTPVQHISAPDFYHSNPVWLTMKIYNRNFQAHGFTLVEVMIALLIVAILVAISFPIYDNQKLKNQRAEAVAMASLLRLEMERCASDNNGDYAAGCAATATGFVLPTIRAKFDPSGGRGDIYGIAINIPDATQYSIVVSNTIGNDADCTSITVNNFGRKTHTGTSPNVIRCWGSD